MEWDITGVGFEDNEDNVPIEFHGRANAIGPRTQHNPRLGLSRHIVLRTVVRHVEIVRLGRIFSRQGIDLFHPRSDAEFGNTMSADRVLVGRSSVDRHQGGNLHVRETVFLGLKHGFFGERVQIRPSDFVVEIRNELAT